MLRDEGIEDVVGGAASFDIEPGKGPPPSNLHQEGEFASTGTPARYATGDSLAYDPLGNILSVARRDSLDRGQGWEASASFRVNGYDHLGRLTTRPWDPAPSVSVHPSYDLAGNSDWEQAVSGTVRYERAAYYGPDQRLRGTDRRTNDGQSPQQRLVEEYRYDRLAGFVRPAAD